MLKHKMFTANSHDKNSPGSLEEVWQKIRDSKTVS